VKKKRNMRENNKSIIFWCFLFLTSLSTTYFVGKKPRGGEISEGYIYPGVIPIVVIVVVVRS